MHLGLRIRTVAGVAYRQIVGPAVVGVSLTLMTPSLRRWAEGGFGQPLELTVRRYLVILVLVPVLSYVVLLIMKVRRPLRMLLIALVLQGAALWGVERADGYRLPVWLDLAAAVIAWCSAWLVVSRR